MAARFSISPAAIASVILFLPGTCHAQELDGKTQEGILVFADRFLVTVFKEDPGLKDMVAYPFTFIAPCKGGTASTFEEFEGLVLSRLGGNLKPPKAYDKRKVTSVARYIRSFPDEMFAKESDQAEKERQEFIKGLGKNVHVAYLVKGNKDGDFAIAVLVRVTDKGPRAVGIGGISWDEANR